MHAAARSDVAMFLLRGAIVVVVVALPPPALPRSGRAADAQAGSSMPVLHTAHSAPRLARHTVAASAGTHLVWRFCVRNPGMTRSSPPASYAVSFGVESSCA